MAPPSVEQALKPQGLLGGDVEQVAEGIDPAGPAVLRKLAEG
jgi:hypothetical protein